MNKIELLAQIESKRNEMRPLTVEAEVSEVRYDAVFKGIEKRTLKKLEQIAEWLEAIYTHQYAELVAVKRLLPQEIWDRYKEWDEEGLAEQVILAEKQANLRRVWNGKKPTTK